MNNQHISHDFHTHLHGRVAVSRNVLNLRAQGVGVPDPDNGAVVTDAQEDPAADGVGQSHNLTCERP